jgi:protein TonB
VGGADPAASASVTKKVEALGAPGAAMEPCTEAVVHAKRKGGPQPSYTPAARQADIEGLVRVEVTIDESGHVVAAVVSAGLGYGLNEAAVAAARRWSFDPATKCGKAVTGTASLPFRFKLGQ